MVTEPEFNIVMTKASKLGFTPKGGVKKAIENVTKGRGVVFENRTYNGKHQFNVTVNWMGDIAIVQINAKGGMHNTSQAQTFGRTVENAGILGAKMNSVWK